MPAGNDGRPTRPGWGRYQQVVAGQSANPAWFVLWTRSNCEQRVYDQLVPKGFDVFLPRIAVWSRRGGLRHLIHVPMFPGYLFLHHAMDKASCLAVREARGLVRILGEPGERPAVVPDREIEAIQRVLAACLPTLACPYLQEGHRVRITRGPLAGLEGILIRVKSNRGMLVLSIELLQRSVAVEVDCTLVVPADSPHHTPQGCRARDYHRYGRTHA